MYCELLNGLHGHLWMRVAGVEASFVQGREIICWCNLLELGVSVLRFEKAGRFQV
jgi:hypothetical protein